MAPLKSSKPWGNKARSHHTDRRQRGFRQEDTLLLTADPEVAGDRRRILSNGVSTVLDLLALPGTPGPQTSLAERLAFLNAQNSANQLPMFSAYDADSVDTPPGRVPLLGHLAAYLRGRPNWYNEPELLPGDLQPHHPPANIDCMGLNPDEPPDGGAELAHPRAQNNLHTRTWLQAADTEGYQPPHDWSKLTDRFQEATARTICLLYNVDREVETFLSDRDRDLEMF